MVKYAKKSEMQEYVKKNIFGANLDNNSTRGWEYPFLLEVLNITPPDSVLDVGCAQNHLHFELAKRGYKVTGVDIWDGEAPNCPNPAFGGFSKKAAKTKGLDIQYLAEDMCMMSLPDNSFDCVVCVSVLEHLESEIDRIWSIDEMKRVLKPGKRLIITEDFRPFGQMDWDYRVHIKSSGMKFLEPVKKLPWIEEIGSDFDTHFNMTAVPGVPFTSVGYCLIKPEEKSKLTKPFGSRATYKDNKVRIEARNRAILKAEEMSKQSNFRLVAKWLERAIDADPYFLKPYKILIKLYENLGDFSSASYVALCFENINNKKTGTRL